MNILTPETLFAIRTSLREALQSKTSWDRDELFNLIDEVLIRRADYELAKIEEQDNEDCIPLASVIEQR